MTGPSQVSNAIAAHLFGIPEFSQLAALCPEAEWDEAVVGEIIDAAGALADGVLAPFNRQADHEGCSLDQGRVRLSSLHESAWTAFVDGGWVGVDAASEHGGMGLPMSVHSACEELFNRASPAFGMLVTPMRCAARVLEQYGSDNIKAEWLPRLAIGEWGATICISEADAGSDVLRLRTRAVRKGDTEWSISGEKMWISFGDHQLTDRIGHMVLARTVDEATDASGLSLFLVPSTIDGRRNGVFVRRIEEKLGLHGSPTCALGFEDASGELIGTINRGLPQLFAMIIGMRLSVGSQGAGVAGAAAGLAWHYAAERKQGGRPDAPPVTINQHGDVKRQLLEMAARAEVARGLVLTASLMSDLRLHETDRVRADEAALLMEWLLPITKNFCAEAAFTCASGAIQVLGGAGYTREWAAEQYLRDARVLSIYEGTSGMQALDLVLRRVLGNEGRSLQMFLDKSRADIANCQDAWAASQASAIVDALAAACAAMDRQTATEVAYPLLQLASYATTAWIAVRLADFSGSSVNDHLANLGRHWLRLAVPAAQSEAALVAAGMDLTSGFDPEAAAFVT
jgi:3-(methylthio)propanoyl-CoA dehydrogenase